jgi:hypothetical protein
VSSHDERMQCQWTRNERRFVYLGADDQEILINNAVRVPNDEKVQANMIKSTGKRLLVCFGICVCNSLTFLTLQGDCSMPS